MITKSLISKQKFAYLATTLTTSILFSVSSFAQSTGFSIDKYLQQCGGKIYSTCDSASLNQETIYNDAKQIAIQENKQIMLVIGADWCPACRQFSAMLKSDEQKEILLSKVILVELNGDLRSTKALAEKLNFSYYAYPQAFVLDAKTDAVNKMFYPSMFNNVQALADHLDLKSSAEIQTPKPQRIGNVDVTVLESDIALTDDFGPSSFYKNPTALEQKFINQGIAAMHVFHYLDAYRSFNMAAKANPKAAMAYVGQIMAMTNIDSFGGDYFNKKAVQQLMEISKDSNLTAEDKVWIQFGKSLAISKASSYTQDELAGTKPMMLAYQDVITIDKDNYDGHGLITWLLISMMPSPDKMFNDILKKDPQNAGAHHYLTHVAEMYNDMQQARYHAGILKDIAKGSAHAQHMYGHTLPQRGDWEEALKYFKLAHQIHLDWAKKYQITPEQDWHYGHNLDLMAAAYLGLNQFDMAIQVWGEAQKFDSRALPHLIALMVINDDKDVDQIIAYYEKMGYADYFKPLRTELDLTTSNVTNELLGESKLDKLMQRVRTEYLARQGKSGNAISDFLGGILGSKPTTDEAFDKTLNSDITSYLAEKFTQGGFDGWSNAYLELLRLKRVAKILSLDDLTSALMPLEFTVQAGGLCSSNPEGKSLTKCLE